MVPIKTSVEDIQKLLGYLNKQVGWVESTKVEKALGSQDDRKLGAMVEFGLIVRDGGNLRATDRGRLFNTDPGAALREVISSVELYSATLEWVHYGKRAEATAAEVGQYWESSHSDSLGGLKGSTLKDGAVTFGRVIGGAGLGTFLVGRSGKETRTTFDLAAVDLLVNGAPPTEDEATLDVDAVDTPETPATPEPAMPVAPVTIATQSLPVPAAPPTVTVATSPSVHINVEIHIAADATADTVREIFKNMARYVLDKHIADDAA
ncbi:hypothetical protein E3T39_01865 [Cryobacterium suzukii]|uniref:DUF5343 domain-containing protein n=1 Tax=Cryobacterium suzukii TaxID=1259198 RepID=A0A4R9AIY2_9MICO|nr:hypothetical protein [Cryobacterium suzukii]TFD62709.1 hypothetical protein E3T39_01865 [Cryobacterium suzukii]